MRTRTPEIASAGGAGQGAKHLLRFATALRVTPHLLCCGSGGWYDRKVPFRSVPPARSNPTTRPIHPLSLVNSHPLQIDPQRSRARSGEADP